MIKKTTFQLTSVHRVDPCIVHPEILNGCNELFACDLIFQAASPGCERKVCVSLQRNATGRTVVNRIIDGLPPTNTMSFVWLGISCCSLKKGGLRRSDDPYLCNTNYDS